MKHILTGLLAATLLSGTGFAQTPSAPRPPAAAPEPVTDPALPTITGPALYVSNLAKSVKFYTEGLGLIVTRSGRLTILANAGSNPPPFIMLQEAPAGTKPMQPMPGPVPGAPPPPVIGMGRIYFATSEPLKLMERLKVAGYAPYIDPAEGVADIVFVRDPDGYLIHIVPGTGASGAKAPPRRRADGAPAGGGAGRPAGGGN